MIYFHFDLYLSLLFDKDSVTKRLKITIVKVQFIFDIFNYLLNFGLVGSGNKKGGASFRDDSP